MRNSALDATPVFTTRKPPGHAQQFGWTLGGPLVPGRTPFFGSYEGRLIRDRNIVVSPDAPQAAVPDRQDEHLPGSGMHYTSDVQTALVTDAVQYSDGLLSEMRGQFARYVDERRDLDPGLYVSRAGYSVAGGALGPLGFGASPEDTWEAHYTLLFWRDGHALKSGGGARHVRAHNESLAYGHGAYFFAGNPEAFPEPFLFVQGLPSAATTCRWTRTISSHASAWPGTSTAAAAWCCAGVWACTPSSTFCIQSTACSSRAQRECHGCLPLKQFPVTLTPVHRDAAIELAWRRLSTAGLVSTQACGALPGRRAWRRISFRTVGSRSSAAGSQPLMRGNAAVVTGTRLSPLGGATIRCASPR